MHYFKRHCCYYYNWSFAWRRHEVVRTLAPKCIHCIYSTLSTRLISRYISEVLCHTVWRFNPCHLFRTTCLNKVYPCWYSWSLTWFIFSIERYAYPCCIFILKKYIRNKHPFNFLLSGEVGKYRRVFSSVNGTQTRIASSF